MFLTEGTRLKSTPAISPSPTTGWQMLYESEVAWHKLEMGMTRLEHSAIVREDHSLLQEGVKEFFSKAKKWFQWAGQEFLRYLDKVIDTWVNIQNRIRTMLINVEDLKKKVNGKEIKIKQGYKDILSKAQNIATSSDAIKKAADTAREDAEKAAKNNDGNYKKDVTASSLLNNDTSGLKELINLPDETNKHSKTDFSNLPGDETLTGDDLVKAINFAKDGRVKCIKTLQYVRNSYAKLINMGIRSADAESEDVKTIKKNSSALRELLNKWISLINKATNAVLAAIGNAKKPESQGKGQGKGGTGFFWN